MADCAVCQEVGFKRPIFFAGQLLTEDDLGALADYVVQKNRLHNRALFGQGVVCGLEVTCDPCGNGKVIVQPGYALDCCGNDILVSCAVELDILKLIRDLRTALSGGFDCGDPCPPPASTPTMALPAPAPNSPRAPDTMLAMEPPRPVPVPASTALTYCLYVRYDEQLAEPVSPYVTDEACSANQSCQPTRVREGWRFELRCQEECKAPDDIFQRATKCFSDIVSGEKSASEAFDLTTGANEIKAANAIIDAKTPYTLKLAITTASTARDDIVRLVGTSPNNPGKPPTDWTKDDVTRLMQNIRSVGQVLAARPFLLPEAGGQTTVDAINTALVNVEPDAMTVVSRAQGQFDSDLNPAQKLDSSLQVAQANAAFRMAIAAAQLDPRNNYQPLEPLQYSMRLLAEGAVDDVELHSAYVDALTDLRSALLSRFEAAPISDCEIRRHIQAITVPPPTPKLSENDTRPFVTATDDLVGALFRKLFDCICAVLNPPCPPCDDPSVLLACIDVHDCEVQHICNLARTFVLSSTAMRYWIPPLTWLGAIVQAACCGGLERLLHGKGGLKADCKLPDFSKIDFGGGKAGSVFAFLGGGGGGGISGSELQRIVDMSAKLARVAVLRARMPVTTIESAGTQAIDVAKTMGSEPTRSQLTSLISDEIGAAVKKGSIDLGPSLRKAAAENLAQLRAEQAKAIANGLRDTIAAPDALAAVAESPELAGALRAAVDSNTADLRKQVSTLGNQLAKARKNNATLLKKINKKLGKRLTALEKERG
jgi:hypothetical protein